MLLLFGTFIATFGSGPFLPGNEVPDSDALPEFTFPMLQPPIGHWEFDETSEFVAADSSGNENPGVLRDFPNGETLWVRGRVGGALNFNMPGEAGNVVEIDDSPFLNFTNGASFSIATWVRSSGAQTSSGGIVCKGFGTGGEQYALDTMDFRFRFFVRPPGGNPVATIHTGQRPNGNWQHLVATYDTAGTMALYLDGRLIGSITNAPSSLLYSTNPVTIGSREVNFQSGYNLPFKGLIDDVRIYDYALNADEVRALQAEAGHFLPMVSVQPVNTEIRVGERVALFASVDGSTPLRYQWFKGGAILPDKTSSSLVLTNLALAEAGDYSVQVTDANGLIASANAVVVAIPFFWQTWWFRLLPIPVLIVGVGGFVHLIEKRKARIALEKLERIHAVDRERMRIARDMHDEIGAKLSRISFLSDLARRSVNGESMVGRQIDEVSDAARDIIQTVDEIVWAVNPRNDTLESLVHYICRHAEEFFELTPVELELELPQKFPSHQFSAEVRHNLFCATKETLNNALKHAGATKVRVSFVMSEASFQIRIKDNGIGFELPSGVPEPVNGELKIVRQGNGLLNIRERLKNVHGEAAIESVPGKGTTVILNVSLKSEVVPGIVARNQKTA